MEHLYRTGDYWVHKKCNSPTWRSAEPISFTKLSVKSGLNSAVRVQSFLIITCPWTSVSDLNMQIGNEFSLLYLVMAIISQINGHQNLLYHNRNTNLLKIICNNSHFYWEPITQDLLRGKLIIYTDKYFVFKVLKNINNYSTHLFFNTF